MLPSLLLLLLACPPRAPRGLEPEYTPAPRAERKLDADVRAYFLRAMVAEERGDLDEAERALAWVLRLDGSDAWAWLAMGRFLERQNRDADALQAFQRANELDPDNLEVEAALGRALVQTGDDAAAEAHLARAVALRDPDALHLLARLYQRVGRFDEALVLLVQWSALPASSSDEAVQRARLARSLGRHDLAVDDLLMALGGDEEPSTTADLLVDSAARSCRLGAAWSWAWSVEADDAGWARAVLGVGRATGDPDLVERGLAALPALASDPAVRDDRLFALWRSGRKDAGLALARGTDWQAAFEGGAPPERVHDDTLSIAARTCAVPLPPEPCDEPGLAEAVERAPAAPSVLDAAAAAYAGCGHPGDARLLRERARRIAPTDARRAGIGSAQ